MTHSSPTFAPLSEGWRVRALNPEAVPNGIRAVVARGIAATVPGEVTLDLIHADLIDDPFDGANEQDQQWIGDVDWEYACSFAWHDDGRERHDLVALGLDTVATIALNERVLAHTNNYHRSYRWDLTGLLHEGENALTVTFSSAVRTSDAREHRVGYYPHTEHHAFNQIRKPSYQFGWDWGIDAANAGIWKRLGIESWSEARVSSVRPLVSITDDGAGDLHVHVEIERADLRRIPSPAESRCFDTPIPVTVTLAGHGVDMTVHGEVPAGRKSIDVHLSVPDVLAWWPIGYGAQPLYDVAVELCSGQEPCWTGKVGFRNVRVDTAADENGRPFQIYVNDVPVHARGYNWVPADVFMSRVNASRYVKLFADLTEANANMVRVWGGSIYEADAFYDLADELGIMVWQDFALACAAYPEDLSTQAEVEAEAREHIARLSSHPSLVVWNGSNENYVAYADWGGFKQALRDDDAVPGAHGYGEKGWGEYYYTTLFPRLLRELDPTRVYLPSSPMSFTPHTDANRDVDGTMHIWDVWNRVDYRHYADYSPRFADEFGYQAPPAWSTLTRVVHDEPLEPFGEQMLVHQKAAGGNYKLARGMRSHLTPGQLSDVSYRSDGSRDWLIDTDRWDDVEDWHWACQLQQAQALRFGVAHMRSLEPVNAGTLIWQLNDDWPVVSWAAVDYDGHRKPLWYASREFFAPHFATIQPRISKRAEEDLTWEGVRPPCDALALVLANDTRQAWSGSWEVQRRSLDGRVLAGQTVEVALPANGHATMMLDASVAHWGDANDEIIVATPSDSTFSRVVYDGAEVVDQHLDPHPLSAEVEVCAGGGYEIAVTAQSYARDVFCMVDKVDAAATIDGGMVTLLAGESVRWHIDAADGCDCEAFTDSRVLRSANDLKG